MDTKTRIFELLDAKNIEQKAFASQVGVSEGTVSNWRRGKSNSYNDYLVQIAQVLGTTTADLLGVTESSPPQKRDRLPDVWYELTDAQKAQAEEFMRFLRAARTEGD